MNTLVRSLVIGLAFSASALSVSATSAAQSSPEQGCSVNSYMDGSPVNSNGIYQDGLGLKRADAYSGISIVRLANAETSLNAAEHGPRDPLGLNSISTRVERLGQGIAATPLVQTLTHPDGGQEPKLSILLLAAAAVVTFVARRRRSL